ncbi:MAG TPA: SpoIIE family protein phosphatase, partial [Gemmataceae bacterium]|nr:SpoIIE family protein phosphatase [Gemmataceae bacterium]
CGHTKTVHVRRDGTCELLHGENVPLGWLRADDYNGFTVPLEVDDLFFFYTDGMTEARKGEEDFGEARLTGLVGSLYGLDPRELVTRVSKEILAFSAPQPPNDDVTCAAVQILDPNRSRGSLKEKLEISSDPRQAPQAVALLRELCQKSPDLTTFTEDLNQLQQAVSEVLKYIVEHAYSGQTDRPIRIEASLFVNRFTVRIYHRGEDFNFTTAKPLQETPRRVDAAQCSRSTYGEQCVSLEKRLTR